MESPENYEYFLILPDDLAINKEGIDLLLNELENPSLELSEYGNKYPVLSGICNLSLDTNTEQMNQVAASISSTLSMYLLSFSNLEKMKDKVIKCAWIGFSCEFIHCSVL